MAKRTRQRRVVLQWYNWNERSFSYHSYYIPSNDKSKSTNCFDIFDYWRKLLDIN